jgi:hypothetical protein
MTIETACGEAGKSMKTYEYYRRSDKVFADKVDRTRLGSALQELCSYRCPRPRLRRVPPEVPPSDYLCPPAEPGRCYRGKGSFLAPSRYEV